MIIKDKWQPTMIRRNARYRGPTELNKYGNLIQEAVHDMKMLGSIMDRNDYAKREGHSDFIRNNFSKYVGGGEGTILSNTPTASTLCHPFRDVEIPTDLSNQSWVSYGSASKAVVGGKVHLSSDGSVDPSGVRNELMVEEGDIIYIRVGVRLLSGDGSAFTIGSENINQGEGDFTSYELNENGSIIYVDKRLYCDQREPIIVNIDLHRIPDNLSSVSVEIESVEMKYMTEAKLGLQPINTEMKSRINVLKDKMENAMKNV